uniref:Suppressor of variegation 3-9 homolog 1 n=1 Tax=Catharus ustulatus TaxID=91951 RepID=A0A8C3UQL6_CATUS
MCEAVRGGGGALCCSVCCLSSWSRLQDLCRLQRLRCRALGVTRRNLGDFEVELLCDYRRVRDEEWYLVKWRGYPPSANTWEPRPVAYLAQKAEQRRALRRWEQHLNLTRSHSGRIAVENEVDLHGPPRDFVYCRDCLAEATLAGGLLPRSVAQQVRLQRGRAGEDQGGAAIYECNSRCRCGEECPNRVVQRGIRYDLLRTLQRIRKNSFVMEYVGEIITSEEAERRGQVYDRQGATYLFDLDYVEDVYTVDAAHYGNISHFVNHSCDPNLQVYNVFIENLDQRLPRIALFATRPIRAGEELTFDYNMHGNGPTCVCLSVQCHTWMGHGHTWGGSGHTCVCQGHTCVCQGHTWVGHGHTWVVQGHTCCVSATPGRVRVTPVCVRVTPGEVLDTPVCQGHTWVVQGHTLGSQNHT